MECDMVRHYRELIVWQKAMDLVMKVYEASECFPQRELFGLTNQLRRSAVSIASNIAEGQGRNTTAEFLRFLSIARGSLQELETQVLIACRLRYMETVVEQALIGRTDEISRLISGLTRSLSQGAG
jgi:four helix bundle protein